jgi:hypothetical protein
MSISGLDSDGDSNISILICSDLTSICGFCVFIKSNCERESPTDNLNLNHVFKLFNVLPPAILSLLQIVIVCSMCLGIAIVMMGMCW